MASKSATCVDCGETHPARTTLNPSPVPSLIDEGIPDSVETAAIHEFIRDIDAEIISREEEIHRLHCEVAELRRRFEQHKAIIAPIRRIPPEIMAEIFCALTAIEAEPSRSTYLYGFVDDADFLAKADKLTRPGLRKAPLIFCQVCRQWRAIALSTPRLWNYITLNCTNAWTKIFLCDMWLKRSGSLPLSIRLHRLWSDNAQQVVDDCQDLLRIILPYAARWRLIDIENVPAASYDVFDGYLPDSLPALEALSIHCDFPSVSSSTHWAGPPTAPKLRLLHFRDIDVDMRAAKWLTFPWSQLTHIDVDRCSTYDFLQILCEAPTAVACKFLIERSSLVQHPPISHSTLQTLRIEFLVQDDIRLGLTCPRLSTLAIWMDSPEHTPRDLADFTARSGATIENFTVEGSNLDDAQFMACLANMPRLRNLKIEELEIDGVPPQFTDEVWKSLTWRPSASPLVPNLESLHLDGGRAFGHKALVRMLESRVRTPNSPGDFAPKLKTMKLIIWRKMNSSAVRRVHAFAKFDLDITLDINFHQEAETGSEASGGEEPDEDDEMEDEEGA
ncbi:hypothetical protein C8R45DRAFT_955487 [Mycena sanguinolenta]|nr:hypothetical protein C8R45DRAFT_955487 [Mycena sanguinolenta]